MPRKQRRDFGSNESAGPGKRRLRWRADMHDGRGYARRSKAIRGTRADDSRFLASMELKYGDDLPCPTIGQAREVWALPDMVEMNKAYLADPKPAERGQRYKMKSSTLRQHLSTWCAHVGPRWENVTATGVRYSDVQQWLDTKTRKVAGRCLVMLRLILRYCVRNGEISHNVAEDDYRMPLAGKTYNHGVWSLEELRDEAQARREVWLSDDGCGEPLSQRAVRRDFQRAQEEAGVRSLQYRALRRSWCSWVATA